MNIIPPPQQGDSDKDRNLSEGIQGSIPPYQHEMNITDGGEFLDDAIRMKDQPYGESTTKADQ